MTRQIKKPEVFEKLLPYAMVLGVAKIWAKEFEGSTPLRHHGIPEHLARLSALLPSAIR